LFCHRVMDNAPTSNPFVPKTRFENCPTCEQPVPQETKICPHCKQPLQVGLETGIDTALDFEAQRTELSRRLKKSPDNTKLRDELALLVYLEAMKLRYDLPQNSLSLFQEVVVISPSHYEARLKVSWLAIRFSKYGLARDILDPVLVEGSDSTQLQKQRAYTNLSCACNWDPEDPAPAKAEQAARAGIALDGEGTAKLWENLATSLRNQQRLEEAQTAFKRALTLNPKSLNAIERQASIERHLKIQRKRREKGEGGGHKSIFKLMTKTPKEKKPEYEKI